jgi:hypothetical protein
MKMIALANSMMTSFVMQSRTYCYAQEQLECSSAPCDSLMSESSE